MAYYWKFTRSGKVSRKYISLIIDVLPDAFDRQANIWHSSLGELERFLILLQDVEGDNDRGFGQDFVRVLNRLGYDAPAGFEAKRQEYSLVRGQAMMGRHAGSEELDWGYCSISDVPVDVDVTGFRYAFFVDAEQERDKPGDKFSCYRSDGNFVPNGEYYDLMPIHDVMVPVVGAMRAVNAERTNRFLESVLGWWPC